MNDLLNRLLDKYYEVFFCNKRNMFNVEGDWYDFKEVVKLL